jgi:hypothetical protein
MDLAFPIFCFAKGVQTHGKPTTVKCVDVFNRKSNAFAPKVQRILNFALMFSPKSPTLLL